jgi:hypothetical protein
MMRLGISKQVLVNRFRVTELRNSTGSLGREERRIRRIDIVNPPNKVICKGKLPVRGSLGTVIPEKTRITQLSKKEVKSSLAAVHRVS